MIDALTVLDTATREAMLFAAVGLLAGGVDDLAVDFLYVGRLASTSISPALVLTGPEWMNRA